MALDERALSTVSRVAAVARQWLVENGDQTLELDEQGFANADEITLCAKVLALTALEVCGQKGG